MQLCSTKAFYLGGCLRNEQWIQQRVGVWGLGSMWCPSHPNMVSLGTKWTSPSAGSNLLIWVQVFLYHSVAIMSEKLLSFIGLYFLSGDTNPCTQNPLAQSVASAQSVLCRRGKPLLQLSRWTVSAAQPVLVGPLVFHSYMLSLVSKQCSSENCFSKDRPCWRADLLPRYWAQLLELKSVQGLGKDFWDFWESEDSFISCPLPDRGLFLGILFLAHSQPRGGLVMPGVPGK
jgi:hypothetical protein